MGNDDPLRQATGKRDIETGLAVESLVLGEAQLEVRQALADLANLVEEAGRLGIDAATLAQVIQLTIGGLDVGVFKEEGRRYDIRMKIDDAELGRAIDTVTTMRTIGTLQRMAARFT